MRKHKILIIILFSIITSCSNRAQINNQNTDLKKLHLHGKVKSVKEYVVKNNKKQISREKLFNKDGNLLKEIYYNNGKYSFKISYQYNKNQMLIKKTFESEHQYSQETYRYNSNNKLTETVITYRDNTKDYFVYKYNKDGLLAEKLLKKGDKNNGKTVYKYKNKELMQEINFNDEGLLISSKTYKKQDSTNFSVITKIRDDIKYKFTKKKDTIIMWKKAFSSIPEIIVKVYDKNHYIISEKTYKSKKLIKEQSFQYELDHQGNWTKKFIVSDNKTQYYIQRDILYYIIKE